MFEHAIAVLVVGSGYEGLDGLDCSDRTNRRLSEWAQAGVDAELLRIELAFCDRMIAPIPCRSCR